MRRVLITGGSGQVGTALIASASAQFEIFAPSSDELDISDARSVGRVFDQFCPNLVINAAAHTAVDRAESERDLAFAINADGAGHVARACKLGRTPLIHLSTDYVFDGTKESAYAEADPPNPVSIYGASKLAGERQIEDAQTPYLILRVSWVFSPIGTNFVKTMLRLSANETLRVVDDQRGTPWWAADIARAIWLSANRVETVVTGRVLHFASHPATTWFGFATEIFETALASGVITRIPRVEPISTAEYATAARRPANSLLDSAPLQRLVGMEAPDWRVSLRDVIQEIAKARA
jgi:dTDP-4-dehydrorhamnose reductase